MSFGGATCPPLAAAPELEKPKRKLPVLPVAAMLRAQQTLTAVERFSKLHEAPDAPLKQKYYRDLIPLERPRAGEQYAFEVDLDACTGCKACVSACHTLNGLDDHELWRTVGLLSGGTPAAPVQQTVTTSCHHCLEPACMLGCPTKAYEKDPVTGIVKHLDDQCFGCQYCTLMCPYDAPKYNAARGIVRKCDMCSDRLAHGEAPACVQACPNGAIAIRVVEQAAVVQASDARGFLPGAPAPEHTLPATQYKTRRALPNNMLPADFHSTKPEHSHPPLVVMLTLTQLSVGAFALAALSEQAVGQRLGSALVQSACACAFALLALSASVFHLGRPLLAWRAVLGLKTSWLSREALVFGLFAGLGLVHAGLIALPRWPAFALAPMLLPLAQPVRLAAVLLGLAGVYCSVMVYVATRREQWSAASTGIKFFGSAFVLGGASVFAVSVFTLPEAARAPSALLWLVLGASAVKLALELRALLAYRDRRNSTHKRMATVMLGELRSVTRARFLLGLGAGGLLPILLLGAPASAPATRVGAFAMLLALLAGELLERYLFFRAAPASRMPGARK